MPIMHSLYRKAGSIRIDRDACKQCGACVEICASEVLALDDDGVRVRDESEMDCVACGHCMMACPERAIDVTGRGISPDDLVPLPTREEMASPEQLTALFLSRRSVRRFKKREVEPEVLARVVEMASMAPMGIPPWDVGCVTVRGRDRIRAIADEVVKAYEGFLPFLKPWLLALMRPFMGKTKHEVYSGLVRSLAEAYVRGHREGRDVVFYDAPALLIFHHSPYADPADEVIACTYAMLAAESLGLGSTMIGAAPPVLQRNRKLCESLGIPAGNTPTLSLIVGYPATHFRHGVRRHLSSVKTVD
jgi:ferredoxin/nitroreductase